MFGLNPCIRKQANVHSVSERRLVCPLTGEKKKKKREKKKELKR